MRNNPAVEQNALRQAMRDELKATLEGNVSINPAIEGLCFRNQENISPISLRAVLSIVRSAARPICLIDCIYFVLDFRLLVYRGPSGNATEIFKTKAGYQSVSSRQELIRLIQSPETEDAAIDFIAGNNGVPRFMAKWAYQHIIKRLADVNLRENSKIA